MKRWLEKRMVIIAAIALTGIAVHLILRVVLHTEPRVYYIPLWVVTQWCNLRIAKKHVSQKPLHNQPSPQHRQQARH